MHKDNAGTAAEKQTVDAIEYIEACPSHVSRLLLVSQSLLASAASNPAKSAKSAELLAAIKTTHTATNAITGDRARRTFVELQKTSCQAAPAAMLVAAANIAVHFAG
ncbi:MAG: hypothetical protein Aurels2KO_25910 [Aureliella sp.]